MPNSSNRQDQDSSPHLSEVMEIGRKALKYGIIALVGYMILKMALSAFVSYWKATHPAPPPPPTVGFGKLPAIKFPLQEDLDLPKSYKLETANGRFPIFGDRAKVFFMPTSQPNLLADNRVREIANDFNFVKEPEVLNSQTYRWTRNQPLETSFEIDSKTLNFSLQTDYLSRPELITDATVPDSYEAVSRVKSLLKSADLLPEEVATNSADVTYLKSLGGELMKAASLSDADFVRVDLSRFPIDGEYRMYTPGGYEGIISGVVTGSLKGGSSVVELNYRFQPKDESQVETYPLRSVDEAWKDFKNGRGYVVPPELKFQEIDQAVIRNVYLGYFDSFEEQSYLQPIYIFSGDDQFLGYIPAIESKYFEEK